MRIGVSGNIGSGKTTLTRLLTRHYGWKPFFEPVIDNPYLEDYYADIGRWAFNLEVYFLKERFKNELLIARDTAATSIQDRTIFEGVYVFAANNYAQGQLSKRDFETYMDLFRQMESVVRYPDLLIYIRSSISNLVEQIRRRGRDYEQSISIGYLQGLNDLYESWISNYNGRVIIVDGDTCKFESDPKALQLITDKIDSMCNVQ